MEHYSILYAPAAKDDLLGIYAYIATELLAPQAAANRTNRIRSVYGGRDPKHLLKETILEE